jgi:hypothetical protein
MAKCHDTVGHAHPYLDTRGLLGLWSINLSLTTVMTWLKAAFIFSLQKSLRPCNDYTLGGTNKDEKGRGQRRIKSSLDFVKHSLI